jgi:hypothetical protein
MRDKRFIALHQGGLLTPEHHRELMRWACHCVEHARNRMDPMLEGPVTDTLVVGMAWTSGQVTVGDARRASVAMHALARSLTDPVQIALARAAGHAVATAHMADHSLGAALYVLKAVSCTGLSVDEEHAWQIRELSSDIRDWVMQGFAAKATHFKLN